MGICNVPKWNELKILIPKHMLSQPSGTKNVMFQQAHVEAHPCNKTCCRNFCQLLLIEPCMPDHPPIPEKQVLLLAKSKWEGGPVMAHCASETV